MQPKKVILGTYNHISPGSSDKTFEQIYQSSWRPYLSVLYKFPAVDSVLFYSGTTLAWIESKHPEFLMLMEEMVDRKQVELLGGGFYSPIFPIISGADRLGQIELLTTYIRKTFGKRPSGGWIYEYAWDPSIPSLFRNSGLNYSFLPQRNFAGKNTEDEVNSDLILTEDQRKTLSIFPVFDLDEIDGKPLPFEEALLRIEARGFQPGIITMMMDGNSVPLAWESSGLESPDVMFERTFAWFQKNCLEYETVTAQQAIKGLKPGKLRYLATACSRKFSESGGALEPESEKSRREVLAKQKIVDNTASSKLFVKMNYVDALIAVLRGDKARKKAAQENLWEAQSGDCYWLGSGGGLRRPEIRAAAFSSLIDAEKTTRLHANSQLGFVFDDIDCDGERELVYQAPDYNCYLHVRGGSVFELDSLKTKHNYLCAYEPKTGESSNSFVDSISSSGLEGWTETVADFSSQTYSVEGYDKDLHRVVLLKKAAIKLSGVMRNVSIRKTYLFQKHCISVDYEVTNDASTPCRMQFATRLHILPKISPGLPRFSIVRGRDAEVVDSAESGATSRHAQVDGFLIETSREKEHVEVRSDTKFQLEMNHTFDVREPSGGVEQTAFSQNEAFFSESLYQGSAFSCGWDLDFGPDSARVFSISLHLEP